MHLLHVLVHLHIRHSAYFWVELEGGVVELLYQLLRILSSGYVFCAELQAQFLLLEFGSSLGIGLDLRFIFGSCVSPLSTTLELI